MPVLDIRIYRAAFLPVIAAVIALMFSVEPVPEPVSPGVPSSEFDVRGAITGIREVTALAGSREPGSEGDRAAADYVAARFDEVPAGAPSQQVFDSSFDGEDVELRNIILMLPGETERTIVVVASRDSVGAQGSGTSAAATGVLLSLADQLGASRHRHTLIFASLSGGSDGSSGAKELIGALPPPERVDAIVVIAEPGTAVLETPHLIPWSSGPQSTSRGLVATAEAALEAGGDLPAGLPGPFGALTRLAFPSGLGDQAPLIEEGYDAIAISAAGERRLSDREGGEGELDTDTLALIGRSAHALLISLDATDGPLEHGPEAQVEISRNLVPGWSLALLAAALILPALAAAIDAFARALRHGEALAAVLWVARVIAPFPATLLLLYLLAFLGLIPDPEFPFDPALHEPGVGGIAALAVLIVALGLGLVLAGPFRASAAAVTARASLLGLLLTLSLVAVWLINPFLALALFGFAHIWTLAARAGEPPPLALSLIAVLLAAVPVGLMIGSLASALELGAATPWHLLLMTTGGQTGFGLSLAISVLAGCVVAVIALSGRPAGRRRHREEDVGSVLGPGGHAGPGALGGTSSAQPGG